MVEALVIAAAVVLCASLMPYRRGDQAAIRCVALFRAAIAGGALGEIGNFFSFASAYQYWRDVTASFGAAWPDEPAFRQMVLEHFGGVEARAEAASCRPAQFTSRVIGGVASVVFRREGADGREAVATAVFEEGAWKVRTYPGVFPGRLLAQARASAAQGARNGEVDNEG